MNTSNFIDSHGEEVKYLCTVTPPCPKPLEVKFKASLHFSYINSHEGYILATSKLNGVPTDCQGSECTLDLDAAEKECKIALICDSACMRALFGHN